MADPKTYTEDEHLGILTERVRRETADLSEKVTTHEATITELQGKLDVAESARAAAEAKATETETAFQAFKDGLEQEREAASKKDSRIAELREVAKHLPETFFSEEDEAGKARVARIVAMDDDGFAGYKADMAGTATAPGAAGTTTTVPRETAMEGKPGTPAATTGSAGRAFMLRDRVPVAAGSEG